MQPSLFINVVRGRLGLEAHDGVWSKRADAVDAAEQHSHVYLFTLTDIGKIDLSGEFSEEYQHSRAIAYEQELKADQAREAQA